MGEMRFKYWAHPCKALSRPSHHREIAPQWLGMQTPLRTPFQNFNWSSVTFKLGCVCECQFPVQNNAASAYRTKFRDRKISIRASLAVTFTGNVAFFPVRSSPTNNLLEKMISCFLRRALAQWIVVNGAPQLTKTKFSTLSWLQLLYWLAAVVE